jgi:flagellar basal-body rod modification protein FlgD
MNSINAYSALGLPTTASTAATTAAATAAKKNNLGQADFLKLMTTQMTHQDPTKPMENTEFLTQMAQFGTVSGIQDLQQSFKDFSTSIGSNQALQAASLVGHTVSAPSTTGLLALGGGIKGSVELASGSPQVNLKILDPKTGAVVSAKNLGAHAAGPLPFAWNGINDAGGLAAPGVYTVQVEAGVDGVNTVLPTDIQSLVESVSMDSSKNTLQVQLAGSSNTVNFNQIKQIL